MGCEGACGCVRVHCVRVHCVRVHVLWLWCVMMHMCGV